MSLEEILASPNEFIQSVFSKKELNLFSIIIRDLGYKDVESYFNDFIHSNDLLFDNFDNYRKTPLENQINRFRYGRKKSLNFPKILSLKPFKFNKNYLPLFTRRGRFEQYYWTLSNKLMKAFTASKFMDPSISLENLVDFIELEKGFAKYLKNFNVDHSDVINQLEMLYVKKKYQSIEVEIIEAPSDNESSKYREIELEFEPLKENDIIKFPLIRLGKNANLIHPIITTIIERNFINDLNDIYSLFDPGTRPKSQRIAWNGTVMSLTLFFDLLIQYKVVAPEEHNLVPEYLDTIFDYVKENGQIEKVKKKTVQGSRNRLPNIITRESDVITSSITNKLIFDLINYHVNKSNID